MKNISRLQGRLHIVQRLPSSRNGNPRYACFVSDKSGTGCSFVTAPDSSLGYTVGNFDGKLVEVTIGTHYGRATLHSIRKITE